MAKNKNGAPGRKPGLNLSELWPGQSVELLKELHILTRDGQLNQDSRRKLKQVQHLVQLITPHLENVTTIADLGAGKSYLGFMLYDLWLREREVSHLFAVESRPDLIATSRDIARASQFTRLTFVESTIENAAAAADLPAQIDAVTALHACDTATDEAIAFALRKQARVVALVPCCQAEAARLIDAMRAEPEELEALWRHGLHRREFGTLLTNVMRGLVLEARGYRVRVTELIGWEHSMKNELILAERLQRSNPLAARKLKALRERFPIALRLFELVDQADAATPPPA